MSSEELKEWKALLRMLHTHVYCYPGQPLDFDRSSARQAWLTRFAALNENCIDGISVSDILYIIHCYCVLIDNHATSKSTNLAGLHELFTRVKLIGNQATIDSTRRHIVWPSAAEWKSLELDVAHMVVFLWQQPESERMKMVAKVKMKDLSSDTAAKVREARCLDWAITPELSVTRTGEYEDEFETQARKEREVAKPTLPPSDVQPGSWWATMVDSKGVEALVSTFIPITSRIVHKVNFDNEFARSVAVRTIPRNVHESVVAPSQRMLLYNWMQRRLEKTDLGSDFDRQLRDVVFEASLPMNTIIGLETRKSATQSRTASLWAMLGNECGFYVLHRTHKVSRDEAKKIASDTQHELHQTFLLTLFGFLMYHTFRVHFNGQFYFSGQNLPRDFKLDATTDAWGCNKRPCIIELQRRIFVTDVEGEDGPSHTLDAQSRKWQRIPCDDIYEAILYWLHLMNTKYQDKLSFSTKITKLADAILRPVEKKAF